MNDRLKKFGHHLLTALMNLYRHIALTASSASAVMVTLMFIAIILIAAGNLDGFVINVEGSLKIHASIDLVTSDEDIKKLEADIQNLKEVDSIKFSTKEEELDTLIQQSGSVFGRYKDNNPMSNAFIIEVKKASDIPIVCEKLNEMDGIEKAQYGGESIENMIKTFDTLRNGTSYLVGGLCLLAVFLISNAIKMSIYTRNVELSIMRSVGATNGYIITPFLIEGICIGMIGALIPILISWISYHFIYQAMNGQFLSRMFLLQHPFPFMLNISLLLIGSGAIVGVLGSLISVTRFLRWRR